MKSLKILLIISLALNAYFGFMYYISWGFGESSNQTWNAMNASQFSCPEGMEIKIEGWGKLGRSRSCQPLRDGKWEGWEEGHKVLDAEYRKGKRKGKWISYYPDGSIYRIVEYKDNIEISNKIVNTK